jgi:hypothetical protein
MVHGKLIFYSAASVSATIVDDFSSSGSGQVIEAFMPALLF